MENTFVFNAETSREQEKKCLEFFTDKQGYTHPIKKFLNEEDLKKPLKGSEWNNFKILANQYKWGKSNFQDKDASGRPIICKRGASEEFMNSLLKDAKELGFQIFCNFKTGRVVVEQDITSNFVIDYLYDCYGAYELSDKEN